jgi:hypothetical protein
VIYSKLLQVDGLQSKLTATQVQATSWLAVSGSGFVVPARFAPVWQRRLQGARAAIYYECLSIVV